jgi:hypothetical protein
LDDRLGESHSLELRQENANAKADRLLKEELRGRRWREKELEARRKNDPEKLEIAAKPRKEKTLTVKGIARRVNFGGPKSANADLHRWVWYLFLIENHQISAAQK